MDNPEFGSSDAASMGGNARKESLSPERRSEIARIAALTRHAAKGKKPLRAIAEAPLIVGEENPVEFECAVLEDEETRVISERAFSRAIGAKRGGSHWVRKRENPGGANLPVFLSANNLRPFISMDLASALSEPTIYINQGGGTAHGIRAELIPKILDVWLKARDAGALRGNGQKQFAKLAEVLMRGLAATGIVALIDAATGFEDRRKKDALVKFLSRYVEEEWKTYIPTFPLSFFRQLCRLNNIPFPDDMRLPKYFGHFINDLVWDRLAPGLKEELRRKNPKDAATGRRKRKHFQWLTDNIGNPKLLHHLGRLEGIADAYEAGQYKEFRAHVDRKFPKFGPIELFADRIGKDGELLPAPTK